MNVMKSFFQLIHQYTLNILMFFLPLWRLMDNIMLILLLVISLVTYIKERKVNLWGSFLFLSFCLYVVLRSTFSNYLSADIDEFVKLLPLILIPIVFQYFSKKELEQGLFYLMLGIFVMQIVASYGVVDFYFFSDYKKIALRSYSKINDVLRFERPYLGFFSAVNFILSYYFIKRQKNKIFYLVILAISVILIFIISARLAFLVILVSVVFMVFNEIKKRKARILVFGIFILSGVLVFVMSQSAIKHRFLMIKYDSRLIIWKGCLNQIQTTSDYIFGVGGQQKLRDDLLEYYKDEAEFDYELEKKRFIRMNYNSHNQFLNEFVRGGLLGLVLFLIPFLYTLYISLRSKQIQNLMLLLSCLMFLFVENLLERQIGVYLIAIIVSINFYGYDKKTN